MPSKPGKEHYLITRFLRAYELGSWTDAELDWLDERQDGAVELVAKRRSDGVTLAIEHTVIQPHPQEKKDFAKFKRTFPADIRDPSLEIPHGFLYIDVPFGALQTGADWTAVAECVLAAIRLDKDSIPDGRSQLRCTSGGRDFVLQTRLVRDPSSPSGKTIIRRYGDFDLASTVKTALATKLPKLVRTAAMRRLLMLERDQWHVDHTALATEIEVCRPGFPEMASVDEIWIAETHDERRIVLFDPVLPGRGYGPVYTFTGDDLHRYPGY
jgi:hypothetical protein